MNIDFVKEKLCNMVGRDARITVYGMRNKTYYYDGVIYKLYPNFFTILYNGDEKSFNYRDIITGDVKIKYL